MRREELQQLIRGPFCVLPTPFDDEFRVDHGRMYEHVQWLVDQGVVTGRSVVKVAAVLGEGQMLTDEEWPALLRTVVQAADGKVPVTSAISHKDTFRSIEDARRAQDLGAIGLQVSPPIFNDPTQDDLLRYYETVSDAIEIGIMVYNTPWFVFQTGQRIGGVRHSLGSVHPDTIVKMADFEHVVAVKWAVPDEYDYEEMSRFSHIFNVIDNNIDPVLGHKLGAKGYFNTYMEMYPAHDLETWDLIESEQYDKARVMYDSVRSAELRAFAAKTSKRSGGPARLKKGMMAVMGRAFGPPRPPSLPLSDEELGELREIVRGFGWPVPEPA